MRYCENCKLRYPDTSRYCQQCGRELVFRAEAVDRQRVLSILKKLPGQKKILENCRIKHYEAEAFFDYILIHEAGVFAFQIHETYRILEGSDKLRYWRAERLADHSVCMIERPVSVLERQQSTLEQVLQKSIFAKTFAFLIYPEGCGLENVVSVKLDQMLTLQRMEDILLHCIRDYGHVYSSTDIDRISGLLSAFHEDIPEPARVTASPVIHADKPHHRARIWGSILLICAILSAFLYTRFLSGRAGQSGADILPGQREPVIAVPFQQRNTTAYTVRARYAALFAGFGEADLDKVASALGFFSLERQTDGSLTVRVRSGEESGTLAVLCSTLDEIITRLFDEKQLKNFTSVRTDNYVQFTVFVTSMDMTEEESLFTEELLRFAVLYAALSGADQEQASVSFYSQSGELCQTVHAA